MCDTRTETCEIVNAFLAAMILIPRVRISCATNRTLKWLGNWALHFTSTSRKDNETGMYELVVSEFV